MFAELRKPLFIASLILIGLVLLAEMGMAVMAPFIEEAGGAAGWGIPMLALLDIQLLYTALLMAAPLLFPESVTGRVQGVLTLIVSLMVLVVGIIAGLAAFGLLMLMIALLTALPFGPLVYTGMGFATFPKAGAAASLSFIVLCKLVSVGCLVFAHQRFMENKGLMLLIGTSLLATVVVSFLQGFVPLFLVSLTDVIGALIVVILALIWALFGLILSTIAVVKALA